MCGVVFLSGPHAVDRLPECIARLRHRGPDGSGEWSAGTTALGFTRLAINGDGSAGHQPHTSGTLVGATNGEIYNWASLAERCGLGAIACDAYVVLPLLARLGPKVLDALDGFYATIAFEPGSRHVLSLRDHIGKKPLFVGRSGTELFIVSELKAFDEISTFSLLPRGLVRVDLDTGEVTQLAEHRPVSPKQGLPELFADAVEKRLPDPTQPVGVFLSGGLDSSLVAAHVARLRADAVYFTLGGAGSPDRSAAEQVADALGLRDVRIIQPPSAFKLASLNRAVVHAAESYNPSIVSNGLATFLLARAAREAGIKVVLTGEGADELFGGYHIFRQDEPWREVRQQLIDDMQYTELRRLDLSCMAHSVEARCPFLDRAVRGFSDNLDYNEMYRGPANKVALRESFSGVLPPEVLNRAKVSFDVGSGIRGQVVRYLRRHGRTEREELQRVWAELFSFDASASHFHAYPAFDVAIDARGEVHR